MPKSSTLATLYQMRTRSRIACLEQWADTREVSRVVAFE
jgi:hypothetical protein